jgi:hypothetical protein
MTFPFFSSIKCSPALTASVIKTTQHDIRHHSADKYRKISTGDPVAMYYQKYQQEWCLNCRSPRGSKTFRQLVHCSYYLAGEPKAACPLNGSPFQDIERVLISCPDGIGWPGVSCAGRHAQGSEVSSDSCRLYQKVT